jgi:hypothetical protein
VKVKVEVLDSPDYHLNTKLARELASIFRLLAERCEAWPDERPRSRTQSGIITGHKGVLITMDLQVAPRVKVIKPLEGAKK